MITEYKLKRIVTLLPDFMTYEFEIFKCQVHKKEAIVFTLQKASEGVPVYELIFTKNHRLQNWEWDLQSFCLMQSLASSPTEAMDHS